MTPEIATIVSEPYRKAVDVVWAVLVDELDVDATALRMESLIYDDLALDSLDLVQLVTEVEDRCGVVLDDEVLEGVTTVESIVDRLAKVIQ